MYVFKNFEGFLEADIGVVQYVPAWIPWIRFKKHMIEGRQAVDAAFTVPYEKVLQERVSGRLVCITY